MIITGQKERIGKWVGEMIECTTPWVNYEAIGIEKNGVIVGGVVINEYVKDARCSIHCAGVGRYWLNRKFLFIVFDYVFRQMKCNCVLNIVDNNNHQSLRFTKHIGFKEIYKINDGGEGGSDATIFEMQKKHCRWIKTADRHNI